MGTQQILMIILSVIVVGAAVAVGIQMFDTQADNMARNAVVSDLMNAAVQAQAWFRTPEMMGGGEYDPTNTVAENIAKYIDRQANAGLWDNANGFYWVVVPTADEANIEIHGVHKKGAEDDGTGYTGDIYYIAAVDLAGGYGGIKINEAP